MSTDFGSAGLSSASGRGAANSQKTASLVLPGLRDRMSSAGDLQSAGARSASAAEAFRGCSPSSTYGTINTIKETVS